MSAVHLKNNYIFYLWLIYKSCYKLQHFSYFVRNTVKLLYQCQGSIFSPLKMQFRKIHGKWMTIVQIVYTQPLLFLMYLNWPVLYFLKLISVRKILIHIEENTFSTVRVENPLGFYKKSYRKYFYCWWKVFLTGF